jgi:putative exonuclease SbcCD C subunit
VAEKLHAAGDLIRRMNHRLDSVTTTHGIGVSLRWKRRDGLDPDLATMVDLLSKPPDLRTVEQDEALRAALSARLDQARKEDPDAAYRDLIGMVLDYRAWHEITLLLRRPGRADERLSRRTALSEGEKKIVAYLPLFAAVAASCDSLAESAADAPRFLLLDDAFAKVSEDNHPKLFGLLVQLDLDFIATSERLWGTHDTVPELAITEVIRDAGMGVIVLEHSRWDGATRTEVH